LVNTESVVVARSELTLRCPNDIERMSDIRSSSAVVSWSRHDFHVRSTNEIRYLLSANFNV